MRNIRVLHDRQQNNNNNDHNTYTPWFFVIGAIVFFLIYQMWHAYRIPLEEVRKMTPEQQFQHISKDPNKFVHTYSENAPMDYQDYERDDITRCVTTQYAVTAFFCGDDVATVELDDILYGGHTKHFRYEISKKHKTHSIYRMHISQSIDELGHTWVVESLPNGNFRMYQSYIHFYTLDQHLQRTPSELTYAQVRQLLDDIDTLEEAQAWTEPIDALYKKWFGVSLLNDKKQWETYGKVYRWRKLNFSWDIACDV